MTGIVASVRNSFDPRCTGSRKIIKKGCAVSLQGAPRRRVIVDFDSEGAPFHPDEARCDYLVAGEHGRDMNWIALLELKKGSLDVGQAVSQLQAGAAKTEERVPDHADTTFRPIAVCGRMPKQQRKELKRRSNMVQFRGLRVAVRLISCGDPLVKALRP